MKDLVHSLYGGIYKMEIKENGLLPEEQEVMDKLLESFHLFADLSREHPDELRDFIDGIHTCQSILAIRICRRLYPKGWLTYTEKN